ncbi:hypothetical protein N8737_01630 [Verrucomicrobia bacterium]|jgi:hypothetical protein|nr:hypothetical protein [Verrucomicrobiota bacterium]
MRLGEEEETLCEERCGQPGSRRSEWTAARRNEQDFSVDYGTGLVVAILIDSSMGVVETVATVSL